MEIFKIKIDISNISYDKVEKKNEIKFEWTTGQTSNMAN